MNGKLNKKQKAILNRYPQVESIEDGLPAHVIEDIKQLSNFKEIDARINEYLHSMCEQW
jgi:hypothetical protein